MQIKTPVRDAPEDGSFFMEKIDSILKRNNVNKVDKYNYDNNVNKNDTSVASKNKYALDRNKFIPNTEEAQLAETIAESFDDLNNYAFYFSVVNKLGVSGAYSFWKSHEDEEEEKRGTRYEFRSSKKVFAWRFKKGLY